MNSGALGNAEYSFIAIVPKSRVVVAPDRVLSMGQIELNCVIKLGHGSVIPGCLCGLIIMKIKQAVIETVSNVDSVPISKIFRGLFEHHAKENEESVPGCNPASFCWRSGRALRSHCCILLGHAGLCANGLSRLWTLGDSQIILWSVTFLHCSLWWMLQSDQRTFYTVSCFAPGTSLGTV